MNLIHTIDDLHVALTRRWWTQLFTAFVRCLLAVAFIPPSIVKILNQPFTSLPDSNPVGHYFNALYQTGFYYQFIGWGQLVAAILLLIPRTAHIGAMMFLPIIVNIAVLTASVGFAGTWVITILMGLAAAYLTAWEYDRLKPIVFWTRRDKSRRLRLLHIAVPAIFAVGGAGMAVLWWYIRLGNFNSYATIGAGLVLTGAIFGLVVSMHYRWMPVGHLKEDTELR